MVCTFKALYFKMSKFYVNPDIYFLIYLFLEIGEGREKERETLMWEKYMDQSVVSHTPPTADLAHNPGMCPNWESSKQPFGSKASAQPTEPHQPQLLTQLFLMSKKKVSPLPPQEKLIVPSVINF